MFLFKKNKPKKTFKIEGMDCASCAMVIESDLEDAGIIAKCSYPKQSLEIENNKNIDEKKMKRIVEKAGYKIKST